MRKTETPRLIRFAVNCDADLFLDLLAVCDLHGVRPEVAASRPTLEPIKRHAPRAKPARRAKDASAKRKPKRYPSRLLVQRAPLLSTDALPAAVVRVYTMLGEIYGDKPFVKGEAKQKLIAMRPGSYSGPITDLMDAGALVPALDAPQGEPKRRKNARGVNGAAAH